MHAGQGGRGEGGCPLACAYLPEARSECLLESPYKRMPSDAALALLTKGSAGELAVIGILLQRGIACQLEALQVNLLKHRREDLYESQRSGLLTG